MDGIQVLTVPSTYHTMTISWHQHHSNGWFDGCYGVMVSLRFEAHKNTISYYLGPWKSPEYCLCRAQVQPLLDEHQCPDCLRLLVLLCFSSVRFFSIISWTKNLTVVQFTTLVQMYDWTHLNMSRRSSSHLEWVRTPEPGINSEIDHNRDQLISITSCAVHNL